MKTLTNKQKLIDRITRVKQLADQNATRCIGNGRTDKLINAKHYISMSDKLNKIRTKVKNLHGSHFVPKRFPSAEYLSIKLSLEEFGIIL